MISFFMLQILPGLVLSESNFYQYCKYKMVSYCDLMCNSMNTNNLVHIFIFVLHFLVNHLSANTILQEDFVFFKGQHSLASYE